MPTAPLFDCDHAGFMHGGVSLYAASCGEGNVPNAARAIGCRISADRRNVRILVAASQATQLLDDVRRNGALATVFSNPSTHRTLQLKGRDAAISEADADDLLAVARYREAFVDETTALGHPAQLIRALLDCPDQDIVAVSFTPNAAFSQTPGPQAGQALKAQS
jgi:hypothetical protein